MRDSGLTDPVTTELLAEAAGLARPDTRSDACARIAAALRCDRVVLFGRDPEIDVLLPPFGMPQTLRDPGAWRAFLHACVAQGEASGVLPDGAGGSAPARGVAAGTDAVLVIQGGAAHDLDPAPARGFLSVLEALFLAERRADAADVRASLAGESATHARTLAESLQATRQRLEASLNEAERSRRQAQVHADQSEGLAEELRLQADHLENQATELEAVNAELEMRTIEAEEARAHADAANRAKSEFLATMSHELRTPINAIIGYSELIGMGISGDLTPVQQAQIERIKASTRHLLTLINDVLDLAKIEAGHIDVLRSESDLRAPVEDALSLVTLQAAERGIRIQDGCPGDVVFFFGDENRVRQIVANLLSNAIKFTPSGGSVSVRCGATTPDDDTPVPGRPGPWAFVEVEDTGIGIPPDQTARVFQPFVQAKMGRDREHGGTGLGLTISRQLARLMGGELDLRSEPGVGSAFTLYLPTRPVEPRPIDDALRVATEADVSG